MLRFFVPTMFSFPIACDPVVCLYFFLFHVSVKIVVGWFSVVVVGDFERGGRGVVFLTSVFVDINDRSCVALLSSKRHELRQRRGHQ